MASDMAIMGELGATTNMFNSSQNFNCGPIRVDMHAEKERTNKAADMGRDRAKLVYSAEGRCERHP